MNTRLQVEHPVTELVTGLDLVRLQIESRRARSCRSPRTRCGCEARQSNAVFMRKIPLIIFPFAGQNRAPRRAFRSGRTRGFGRLRRFHVPLDYDPMLAKLIVWHETREHAIERMLRALGEYT